MSAQLFLDFHNSVMTGSCIEFARVFLLSDRVRVNVPLVVRTFRLRTTRLCNLTSDDGYCFLECRVFEMCSASTVKSSVKCTTLFVQIREIGWDERSFLV